MNVQRPLVSRTIGRPRRGTAREMFLTSDSWYMADASMRRAVPRRCGTLEQFARRYLPPALPPEGLVPPALAGAFSVIDQTRTLSFVFLDLIPVLRTLPGAEASLTTRPPEPPVERIHGLVERASRLRRRFEEHGLTAASCEGLAAWLGTPCAIVDRMVVPLEPISEDRFTMGRERLTLAGQPYIYRPDRVRPFEELRAAFRRVAVARARNSVRQDDGLGREAAEFLADVESLLSGYNPEFPGRFRCFYRDRHHEVHHSRGCWALVRGPVQKRTGHGFLFVGLHLRGASREELLSVSPSAGKSPAAFWGRAGEPCGGGLCMGDESQFRRLYSSCFTEAEAVVQWTDAGAILVTGRSLLHQAWRETGQKFSWDELLGERRRPAPHRG